MITYFVHSISIDNERGVRSGWQELGLSDRGKELALQLQDVIADKEFDLVFSSDLLRAKQTAQLAFPDYDVQYDQRLREMNYGDLNGAHSDDFPADEMWCIENRFINGESCLDVQARIQDFMDSSVPQGANVAIIAHRYPQLALDVICNQRTWSEAIATDWRLVGEWQPGWTYSL